MNKQTILRVIMSMLLTVACTGTVAACNSDASDNVVTVEKTDGIMQLYTDRLIDSLPDFSVEYEGCEIFVTNRSPQGALWIRTDADGSEYEDWDKIPNRDNRKLKNSSEKLLYHADLPVTYRSKASLRWDLNAENGYLSIMNADSDGVYDYLIFIAKDGGHYAGYTILSVMLQNNGFELITETVASVSIPKVDGIYQSVTTAWMDKQIDDAISAHQTKNAVVF